MTTAGSDTYTYDANGNQLTGAGRTLTYTAFNKVASIVKGNRTISFAYGPDRSRTKRTDTDSRGTAVTSDDTTTTTLYLGTVEKVTSPSGSYAYKRYLAGGAALIMHAYESTTTTDGVATLTETLVRQYLLKDHLGSVAVITDGVGTVVRALSYDAWGVRRNAATWGELTALALMSFDAGHASRGYTGHEMLDTVGIIHMNGRIYDAKLGRFMQADPVIQFPHYSQSHNRYSYVLNNPLNATDPSGYIFKKLFKGLNKIFGDFAPFVSIALLAIPGVNAWVTTSWVNAFQFGFVTGGIATGSLRGALFGGISGAAFIGIGSKFTAETGFFQAGGVGHVAIRPPV